MTAVSPPFEPASPRGAIKGADAGGQRLRQRAQPQRHIVGQLVDLRPRQHLEVDVDIFGETAPEVRRLLEAEIAPVVDRRQTFVGVLWVVQAVVATTAGHQRRDHHLRSDVDRLAHEVLGQILALLDDNAADLMTKRERPRQWLWPVTLQNVLVSSANAARADFD